MNSFQIITLCKQDKYNKKMKILYPYLLILLGLFLLFFLGQALVAGVFILLGIVIVIEKKWPEQWENVDI